MSELRLSLLGQVTILQDGVPVRGFKSSKAVALLCYLALTGEPCARSTLAGLFWGELSEANARMNLRKVLTNLRGLIGSHLRITRHTVAFEHGSSYWLDVERFERGLEDASQERATEHLQDAVELYRGDFLAGLDVRDANGFEEWLTRQRTRLWEQAVQALDRLASSHVDQGKYELAIDYTRRHLDLEPWSERAHRRLMHLLARSGQINAALAHYETCRQVLAEALSIEPSAETIDVYNRIRGAAHARRHHLPSPNTPFVGREPELAAITGALTDPACRLLTLAGPGGIGKTRLALEAAAKSTNLFLHGVAFVSLASVTMTELMVPTVANALHLPLQSREKPEMQVFDYLQAREMLLVFDNMEHMLAGKGLLREFLDTAPGIKILTTSRVRLSLNAEWVLEVSGLSFPHGRSLEPLEQFSAARLFHQTARRVQPTFGIDETNSSAIVQICQLVEGMPLGIELAAAWTRALSCEEIARELGCGFDLLATAGADVHGRHHSLRAVFEHSWALLSTIEQQAFEQLSVFRHGFQRAAAHAICGIDVLTLVRLVDKSFLQYADRERYDVHEMLRRFAAEKLQVHDDQVDDQAQCGGAERVYRDHCHYYLTLVADRESTLHGEAPQAAVALVQADLDNVRQAWRWAVEHGEWALLERCLPAWLRFYSLSGLYPEASGCLDQALYNLHRHAGAGLPTPAVYRLQSHVLVCLADMLIMRADYQQAMSHAEEADALATLYRHPDVQARAQAALGYIYQFRREYDHALLYQQRAHHLLWPHGDRRQLGHLLLQMGTTCEHRHQWTRALDLQSEALRLFQELGDRWSVAASWGAMGSVHYGAGQLDQALRCDQKALEMAQHLNARAEIVRYTTEIAKVYWRTHQFSDALACFERARVLAEDLGLEHNLSAVYRMAGVISQRTGQFREAYAYLEHAIRLAEKAGAVAFQVDALAALSSLYDTEGQYHAARRQIERATQLAQSLGARWLIATCTSHLGFFYYRLGDDREAKRLLEQAIRDMQAFAASPNVPALPLALRNLAEVLHHQGQYQAAEARCREALQIIGDSATTMFESTLLTSRTTVMLAKCRAAQGYRDEAVRSLLTVHARTADREQQALVADTLWELTQDDAYGHEACGLYRRLYAQVPQFAYKQRIDALERALQPT